MWDAAFKAVEHLINQYGKKKLPSLKKLVILSEKKICGIFKSIIKVWT
jgi:hypothetical protein